MSEDELEALRQRRMAQLQAQAEGGMDLQAHMEAAALQQAQTEALKENLLRKILTNEAKARLARVRMAHPQQAQLLESQLMALAQSGQLRQVVDEATLVQLMSRLKPSKREITITRR